MWKSSNLFSAMLPVLLISKIVGLAPYSFTSYMQRDTGSILETKIFKTSMFDISYSIAVLILYITTFPFFVMWKISKMYSTFGDGSITFIIIDCLSVSLQFMTSVLSICEIVLRNRQIIRQTVLDMFQVDVLLGINSTTCVYRKTAAAMLVQVLCWCAALGVLYHFDFELWYKGKEILYGLSKYVTNSIRIVMVIQFVNFVYYVKSRFKMINSEIIKTFGFCDEMELDDYLLQLSQWYLMKSKDANLTKRGHANPSKPQLKYSDYSKDGLRRQSLRSRIHVLRDVHFRLNHIATTINSVYQVPILFEVMAVLTIIALKFHLGLVTIFFENVTSSPMTLFLSLSFWWIVLHLSKLVLIMTACQYATRHSARTALVVQKVALLKPLHPDTLFELQLFSQQLLHHKLVFSPCGFFTLNHCFLSSCVESLVTYIIILLQFTHAKN
jgi:hypothetical protein